MRIIIIEDEIPAQRLLKKFILELNPEGQIEAILGSVAESIEWLKTHSHPDLIFMDVQLSDGLAFRILEQVVPESFIIFTTAYDQYAIQAFNANTIDYLLKPIKKIQLEKAFQKLSERTRHFQKIALQDIDFKNIFQNFMLEKPHYRERFLINQGDTWYKLNVPDVAFFYLENKLTYAVTFEEKKHLLDLNLDQIMTSLDPKHFFRTNRQTIVNIEAIHKIKNWFNGKLLVITKPEHTEKIIVAREKARLFRDLWLNE